MVPRIINGVKSEPMIPFIVYEPHLAMVTITVIYSGTSRA